MDFLKRRSLSQDLKGEGVSPLISEEELQAEGTKGVWKFPRRTVSGRKVNTAEMLLLHREHRGQGQALAEGQ